MRSAINNTIFLSRFAKALVKPPQTTATATATTVDRLSIAVKDNICVAGEPTTCASRVLQDYIPPFHATCVQLLLDAGHSVIGKTNMDEFGMGSHTQTSAFGPTFKNPHHSCGGSSGGSAMAVALGLTDVALGTDTGGSVRLPAAACHLVGFKPSYGMISRFGVVPYAHSLECVGLLANNIEHVQSIFSVLNQHDTRDSTSLPDHIRSRNSLRTSDKIRVGIPVEYYSNLCPRTRDAFTTLLPKLAKEGWELQPVSLPTTRFALSAYYILAPAEAASNLAKYARRRNEFGQEVKKRILVGNYALMSDQVENYYLQACKIRRLVRDEFARAFEDIDILLTPVINQPEIPLSSIPTGPEQYLIDRLLVPANLAGIPAISIPTGHQKIAVQLLSEFGSDDRLLKIAKIIMELA